MSNQKQHDQDVSTPIDGLRKQFRPGGKLAPINDLAEYERQMNALPPGERELAQEVTICANMCQFWPKNGWTKSGTTSPIARVRPVTSARAARFGR